MTEDLDRLDDLLVVADVIERLTTGEGISPGPWHPVRSGDPAAYSWWLDNAAGDSSFPDPEDVATIVNSADPATIRSLVAAVRERDGAYRERNALVAALIRSHGWPAQSVGADMTPKTEYRVSWKREGLRRKSRTFASRPTAEKHADRLATESDDDLHWRCDEGHGRHITGNGDVEYGCMPPIVWGPLIEERKVGPWT